MSNKVHTGAGEIALRYKSRLKVDWLIILMCCIAWSSGAVYLLFKTMFWSRDLWDALHRILEALILAGAVVFSRQDLRQRSFVWSTLYIGRASITQVLHNQATTVDLKQNWTSTYYYRFAFIRRHNQRLGRVPRKVPTRLEQNGQIVWLLPTYLTPTIAPNQLPNALQSVWSQYGIS